MSELIKVGMADLKVGRNPDSLISYGLGSCVGIALYDPQAKVGGLAHIMLPDSTQARATDNTAKFADTALPILLDQIIRLGAVKSRMIAKIAGGSQMFNFAQATDVMRIGDRNVEAVREVLKSLSIRLVADDVGGNYGRTVELLLDTGVFVIKTVSKGDNRL
jgi:chemotaxis protein CheD